MKKSLALLACSAVAATGAVFASAPAQAAGLANAGTYYSATQARLADTRSGVGVPKARLKKGSSVAVQVLGKAGVPTAGVSAVVVNLTADSTGGGGWVTAYASGTAKPPTSSLNFGAKWTGAATTTVAVGADGKIRLDVGNGDLDLIVDVIGYYGSAKGTGTHGASFFGMEGFRVEDTRKTSILKPGATLRVALPFGGMDPQFPMTPKAVRVNLTALASTGRGWLTAWSGSGAAPGISSVNVAKGEVSPNSTIVPLRNEGAGMFSFSIKNTSAVNIHAVVDLEGLYAFELDGPSVIRTAITPTRLVDTRYGKGAPKAKLGAGKTIFVKPVAAQLDYALGFEGTLTGVGASGGTWLTQFSGESPRPQTSNLNLAAGQTRANGVATAYGAVEPNFDPRFAVYNSTAPTDVVVDVTAQFTITPGTFPFATKKAVSIQQRVHSAAAHATTSVR